MASSLRLTMIAAALALTALLAGCAAAPPPTDAATTAKSRRGVVIASRLSPPKGPNAPDAVEHIVRLENGTEIKVVQSEALRAGARVEVIGDAAQARLVPEPDRRVAAAPLPAPGPAARAQNKLESAGPFRAVGPSAPPAAAPKPTPAPAPPPPTPSPGPPPAMTPPAPPPAPPPPAAPSLPLPTDAPYPFKASLAITASRPEAEQIWDQLLTEAPGLAQIDHLIAPYDRPGQGPGWRLYIFGDAQAVLAQCPALAQLKRPCQPF